MALPTRASRVALVLFCSVLIALPLLAVASAIWITRTDWFLSKAAPGYVRGVEYEFSLRNHPCDILIYGDSSALTGLEPAVFTRETGMSACSVAQTRGTTCVSGERTLQLYMARNPAPRWLVFAYAPEDWVTKCDWSDVSYSEGLIQMIRHFPPWETARTLLAHPGETLSYTASVLDVTRTTLLGHSWDPLAKQNPEEENGHVTLPRPVETYCDWQRKTVTPPEPAFADHLRAYATKQTRVLVAVAPIADCDAQIDYYRRALGPLHADFPLRIFPIVSFNHVGRHFSRAGSALFSQQVAQLIVARDTPAQGHAQ